MVLKAAAAIAALGALAMLVLLIGFNRAAEPVQPVKFSHKLHATEFKIGCLYCHVNARRSNVAGIPSLQLCMGCHKNVGKNKRGVEQLTRAWEQRRVIEWIKINDLPDFVYFTHKRHVKADVACQECHGPVETMSQVKPGRALSMEVCVNCHLQRKASVDCWTCHK